MTEQSQTSARQTAGILAEEFVTAEAGVSEPKAGELLGSYWQVWVLKDTGFDARFGQQRSAIDSR
jgi:hypothetical protein